MCVLSWRFKFRYSKSSIEVIQSYLTSWGTVPDIFFVYFPGKTGEKENHPNNSTRSHITLSLAQDRLGPATLPEVRERETSYIT